MPPATDRRRTHRRGLAVALLALLVIAGYLVRMFAMSHSEVVRSDYLHQQVAGILWSNGQGSSLYVDQVQGPVYARLAAGDHTGDLLYNHAPLTAVLAAPLAGLDPDTGHRLWSLFQLLLAVGGALLAAWAAPWPKETPRSVKAACVAVAMAGAGTLPMLLEGQGLGAITLGLGAAYAAWRRGRLGFGGAALVLGAAVAKPHLALGLLAFLVGWRDRRVLLGVVAGGAVALALSLLAVGWDGVAGFVTTSVRSNGLWPQAQLFGFTGLFATWLGEGLAANVLAYACSLGALIAAVLVGDAFRRGRVSLEFGLFAATALSLVASPHLYSHDLVLLAPPFIAAMAYAATRATSMASWPGRSSRSLIEVWLLLLVAAGADAALTLPRIAGRLTVYALLVITVVALRSGGLVRARREQPVAASVAPS